jgi:hypothetical protein
MSRAVVATVVALVAMSAPATATALPSGGWIGESGGVAVGVVVNNGVLRAYVCDGKRVGRWYDGVRSERGLVRLGRGRGRLVLATRGRGIEARLAIGRERRVLLRAARRRTGLFRADVERRGKRSVAGWIVLSSRRQVGVVTKAGTPRTAPRLVTSNLVAGSLTAERVLPATGTQTLLLDYSGNGIDTSARVTTALAGGRARTIDWTKPGSDDTFVGVDATALRTHGYRLATTSGVRLDGLVLARDGLVVTDPSGSSTTTSGAFHLLRVLDGDGDGRLGPADPAYHAVRRFRDANGDGLAQPDEQREKLDSLAELSGEDQLSLQAQMDKQNELNRLISNLLKQGQATVAAITANLK